MLTAAHQKMLAEESAIDPAVIVARGYRSVTSQEAREYGFTGQQQRAGLLIPVHTTDGQLPLYVLRPDRPRVVEDKRTKKDPYTGDRPQKVYKYEWPRGQEPRLDCPPPCLPQLKDATTPLWITEGQKKGDALASWGLCAIDLPNGVWGWKSKQQGILADLDAIVWAGRQVYIVFDSDVMTKPNVSQALARLSTLLSRRGATVTPVPLPQQGDDKLGVDDFKAGGGTLAQLQAFAGLGGLLPLRTDDRPPTEAESAEYLKTLADLGYRFTMNAIDDTLEVNGRPMSDGLRALLRTRMRDLGYKNVNVIEDAYTAWAYLHQHHPVRDRLLALAWDGAPHIAALTAFGRDDHAAVYRAVTGERGYSGHGVFYLFLRRWLIGAVGKALDARQSMMLILDGPQAIGKSYLVRFLGSLLPDYFIESPLNPDDKDSWLRLMSRFIWELPELGENFRKGDREQIKNFVSTRVVTLRRPYGRYDIIKPALASLIGTLNNEAGFLTDPTGNRRFLTCQLTHLDWAYSRAIDIEQLWAEAVALYRQGEPTLPTPVEQRLQNAINADYMVELPLEMLLHQHFGFKPELDLWMPAIDIVKRLEELGLRDGHQRQHLRDLSAVLQQLGVPKTRRQVDGRRAIAYKGIFETTSANGGRNV